MFAVTPTPTSRAHALREWVRAALLTLPSGSSACSLTAAVDGIRSALEAIALVLWHLGGLPAPIQQAIVRSGGRFLARVDFLWPEAMLVVEVDGMGKYAEPFALREEKRRQNNLVADGYLVLRFTWDDIVRRPNVVVHRIAAVLGVPFTELAADWARSGRK